MAGKCLEQKNVDEKIKLSNETYHLFSCGKLILDRKNDFDSYLKVGMPALPKLVQARKLPRRQISTNNGKLAMLHALSHIEFNAINIAWDAVYRYRDMPENYYHDWVQIANEETHHFCLLRGHLAKHGIDYGQLDAHDGLWRVVEKTAHDLLVRMAVVPGMYEAKGLDVSPDMICNFEKLGEFEISQTLKIIYHDEINHVAKGNYWFNYLCRERKIDPESTFIELADKYLGKGPKHELNREARLAAGFTDMQLKLLEER